MYIRKYGLHKLIEVLSIMLLLSMLAGCTHGDDDIPKIVLTSGFAKDEIFRIENQSCTLPEIMVYLTNIQDQYEDVYGDRIWDTKIDGVSLENNIKDMTLSKIAQVKAINLLADQKRISLNDDELQKVTEATDRYWSSLSAAEIEAMGIDRDVILKLYTEYAVSEKLYQEIIKDINPEISDDEARRITVEHILIKTYTLDENGNRQKCTEYAKQLALQKANEALERAKAGEDFERLAEEYSDDLTLTYSFGKSEMDAVFENAAFNLGNGEISDIIETEYGYHIIKCLSTFNKEETDSNKYQIVEKRRNEAFTEEYNEFVSTLTKNLNTELWDEVTFSRDPRVKTCNFFEIFDEYWNGD